MKDGCSDHHTEHRHTRADNGDTKEGRTDAGKQMHLHQVYKRYRRDLERLKKAAYKKKVEKTSHVSYPLEYQTC